MGRAAKIAALKLRVSRAGRALLGLPPGSSGKPRSSGKLSELGDKRRTRGSVPRGSFGFRFGARGTRCERSNTSQLSARRRKLRANAGPARGSFSFASIRTSSQLLRLQVLRVGRAAKLAALKLRISRAGRAFFRLAAGEKPRSSGKLSELGDKSRRTRGSVSRGSFGFSAASAQTHRS